jgi:endonuclease/exonuclease/phosphatase family metal-dependent hydrolase
MKKSPGKQILCGDFNLDLETKSVALLEENLRNLIREKGIITTRHPEYYPKYNEMPFADYTFVTNDVLVRKFEVPQEPVSDHLPMILEFE